MSDFADLMKGPAKNWLKQLSREVRLKWPQLCEEFEGQYCNSGVSVTRQYYHIKKRSDETPIEYLHRLNVAGLRAKTPIKDPRHPDIAREHVEHFIGTLDNRDLADQLTLLRIKDSEQLKLTLRTLQRAKTRQPKVEVGSNRYRSKPHPDQGKIPAARPAREIRMITKESDSSGSEKESGQSGLSSDEVQYRHIFTTEPVYRPRTSTNGMDGRKPGVQPDQDRSRKKCVNQTWRS